MCVVILDLFLLTLDLAQSPATQPIFIVYLAQYVFGVNQINTSDTFVRKPD